MSQDSTKPKAWALDDEFMAVQEADVRDENPNMLANLLRALAAEVRSGFEMLREEMRSERRAREAVLDRVEELERITPLRRKAKK